jgi:hypothetical protein
MLISITTEEVEAGAPCQAKGSDLVIADGLCPRIGELLPAVRHELVALGADADPLATIAAELGARRQAGFPVHTLHLLAHGRAGAFQLGNGWIDAAALVRGAGPLAHWRVARITLWSCDTGADRAFTSLLGELTGAAVWASTEAISSARPWIGGEGNAPEAANRWSLEAILRPNTLSRWQGTLATDPIFDVDYKPYPFRGRDGSPGTSTLLNP